MKMTPMDLLKKRYFRFQRLCSENASYDLIQLHRQKVAEAERMAMEAGHSLGEIRDLRREVAAKIGGKSWLTGYGAWNLRRDEQKRA